MASRNYAMAYDTPYNEKLLSTLRKYDMERDTNGEPNHFRQHMEGGAFLASDGQVSRNPIRFHPHLSHPLLGSMSREMRGGFGFRDVKRAFAPVGRVGMDVARELGKYALQEGQKEATRRGRDYADAYMSGQGVMSGGLRPPGMVSPFVQSASPSHMVSPGTSATYPVYNAVEMRALNGGFFGPLAMGVARVAGPAIASSIVGALANKAIEKVTGSGVCACEGECGCVKKKRGRPKKGGSLLSSKASSVLEPKKRGRPKKGGNILDRKFSINDVKNTGRELLGLGILDEKFSINDVGRTGKQLLGLGVKKRGRPKKGGSILDEKFSINEVKDTGRKLLGLGVKKRGRPKKGAGLFEDIGKGLKGVASTVGSVALPIAKDVAVDVAKSALTSYISGKSGSKAKAKSGKGVKSGGLAGVGVMSGGKMDGRKRRAEIVKKVMKEKGLKMVEASKYVKQHGLY